MSIFNQFPYTNVHEMNLDWVLKTVKNALETVEDVVSEYFADHLDSTLTDPNKAAQAYATGVRIGNLESSSASMGLRLTLMEDRLHDIFDFTLSKSDAGLTYNDIISTDDDMSELYTKLSNNIPVFVYVDGEEYKAKTAGATGIIIYKDVPEYECTIHSNASTGTAVYMGFITVDKTAVSYISGTWTAVKRYAIDGTLQTICTLFDVSAGTRYAVESYTFDNSVPGGGDWVDVTFTDGTIITFHADGTLEI